MYKRRFDIIVLLTCTLAIPLMILLITAPKNEDLPEATELTATVDDTKPPEKLDTLTIQVYMQDGTLYDMVLNDYLIGVLMAEMPAEFEPDALKAQAVVSRTYALKRAKGNTKHPGAVCTDSGCCQGFMSKEAYLRKFGKEEDILKIQQAVTETNNLVLVYNGGLIEATYFSCSGGQTEDAMAVWGWDIPYLQSINSPGEENARHFTDTVRLSTRELAEKLQISPSENPCRWIGEITYTDGGGVKEIEIAGKKYSGTEFRRLLGLRSTAFVITIIGQTAVITTKGFGHRVGMSQYGADAMAVAGKTFDEILRYYYKGTELMMYGEEH